MKYGSTENKLLPLALILFFLFFGLTLTPGLSLVAVWFLVFPLILLTVLRRRLLVGGLCCVISLGLLTVGFGWSAIIFSLGIYFTARAMGEGIGDREAPYRPLIFGTLVFLMLELVLLALVRFAGIDIYGTLTSVLKSAYAQDERLFHLSSNATAGLAEKSVAWVHLMLPGVLTVYAFFLAAINLVLARRVLRTQKFNLEPLLLSYQLPNDTVLVYGLGLIALLIGLGKNQPFWWQVVNNATFISGFFIGIQGLCFLWRRLYRKRGKSAWLVLIIVLPVLHPIIRSVYIFLGMFDLMLRRRKS